jgi:ATP-dependent helicase HrpA
VLRLAHEVTLRLEALPAESAVREDLEVQLEGLVPRGFVTSVGAERLPDLVRYLQGMRRRLEVAPGEPGKDAARMVRVHEVEDAYHDVVDRLPAGRILDPDVQDVRWLLEEYRVSVFAQQLGTPRPVSDKRIRTALARLA